MGTAYIRNGCDFGQLCACARVSLERIRVQDTNEVASKVRTAARPQQSIYDLAYGVVRRWQRRRLHDGVTYKPKRCNLSFSCTSSQLRWYISNFVCLLDRIRRSTIYMFLSCLFAHDAPVCECVACASHTSIHTEIHTILCRYIYIIFHRRVFSLNAIAGSRCTSFADWHRRMSGKVVIRVCLASDLFSECGQCHVTVYTNYTHIG